MPSPGSTIRRELGGFPDLKRGDRSALAVALTCASVLAAVHYAAAQAPATQDGTAVLRLAAADVSEKAGKKAGSHRSRDKKSKEAKTREKRSKSHKTAKSAGRHDARKEESVKPPSEPLEQASPQESADPDIALVRKAIDDLRRGGAGKATEIEASISDPAARKLVEWIILRSYNSGAGSSRYLSFIAANPSWPSLAIFRRYRTRYLPHQHRELTPPGRFFFPPQHRELGANAPPIAGIVDPFAEPVGLQPVHELSDVRPHALLV